MSFRVSDFLNKNRILPRSWIGRWRIREVKISSSRLVVCCVTLLGAGAGARSFAPRNGFVSDSATAVKIAEAVLIPAYGKEEVESERPFKAKLENGGWIVDGTLHCRDSKGQESQGCDGGTAEVRLSKADGRILSMIHYQ